MAYVYVLNGRERYAVFPLMKDVTTFGQRDDADVVLKDPWISWTHARIVREGSGFTLEDLGSTNGTYVDCVRVKRRVLEDDDVIFLGRTHLLFVASSRLPSAPPPGARPREPITERAASTEKLRTRPKTTITDPDAPQPIPELAQSGDSRDAFEFRGPFEDYGRIDELEEVANEPDTDGFLAPPPIEPEAAAASAWDSRGDSADLDPDASAEAAGAALAEAAALEIDVADLLDSTGQVLARQSSAAGDSDDEGLAPLDVEEPLAAGSSSSDELDPIAARDAEIERLRAAVQHRDAEIRKLRDEIRRLKEQYLDL